MCWFQLGLMSRDSSDWPLCISWRWSPIVSIYVTVSNSDLVETQVRDCVGILRNEVLFSAEKTEKWLYLESIYLWVNVS